MNGRAVRQAFEEGVARIEQALTAGRRIAWLSLAASVVALAGRVSPLPARTMFPFCAESATSSASRLAHSPIRNAI